MPSQAGARAREFQEEVVPFTAGDGLQCNLIHVRGERMPHKGPVLLVHGAGVRANIFRAPVERTLVDMMVEEGYEVWLENWRASIDFAPCTKATRSRIAYKNDAVAAYPYIGAPGCAPGAINQGAATNQDVDAVLGTSGNGAGEKRRRHKS